MSVIIKKLRLADEVVDYRKSADLAYLIGRFQHHYYVDLIIT